MSVLQELIVKFNNKKSSQLFTRIIHEIQTAESLWAAISPASNNYFLGNENGKAAAYLFSDPDYFDVFYVHKNQKGYEVKSVENPVKYRMALFADLYRSGFEVIVIDNGQTYLKLNLFDIIKKPEHSKENKDTKLIINPSLMRTASWFLQEDAESPANADMWRLMFSEILNAEYIVPADTSKLKIEGVKSGEIKLNKDSEVSFPVLQNAQGKNYYPFFTDYNELRKYDMNSNCSVLAATFKDIEIFAEKSDGIVINPFGANIVLTAEMLDEIKKISAENKKKKSKIVVGSPEEYPVDMIKSMTDYFNNVPEITSAYLKLMQKDGNSSYLVAIECDNENPIEMYNKIAEAAVPKADGMPIDFIDIKSDFAQRAFKDSEPFYIKKPLSTT